MKYELKDTEELYVKVYPYSSYWVKPSYCDADCIKREVERHVDDIGSVEVVQERIYTYEEDGTTFEGDNLTELCSEIAYYRDTLTDEVRWEVKWIRNNEKYSRIIWNLEDLLDCVSRYNCEIVSGSLSENQKALVDVAKSLYVEKREE